MIYTGVRVNGLTPTGDGNPQVKRIEVTLFPCVNGLTPTGDGNSWTVLYLQLFSCVNGLTPTGDGNNSETTLMK